MKKTVLLGWAALAFLGAQAQSFQEWQDANVNEVNRAPMHTHFFAYETTEAADKAVS